MHPYRRMRLLDTIWEAFRVVGLVGLGLLIGVVVIALIGIGVLSFTGSTPIPFGVGFISIPVGLIVLGFGGMWLVDN